MTSPDLLVDRLTDRARTHAARARMYLRHGQRADARLLIKRAGQLLELAAQARLAHAVAILESK